MPDDDRPTEVDVPEEPPQLIALPDLRGQVKVAGRQEPSVSDKKPDPPPAGNG